MAVDCRKCRRFDSCYYDYDEDCIGFIPYEESKREKQKAHANEILENYWKRKSSKLTNADRIRSMTDEELAAFLTDDFCELLNCTGPCDGQCEKRVSDWLKQEATE